jgi:hypothetical protein
MRSASPEGGLAVVEVSGSAFAVMGSLRAKSVGPLEMNRAGKKFRTATRLNTNLFTTCSRQPSPSVTPVCSS